jgi:hypothetical protein
MYRIHTGWANERASRTTAFHTACIGSIRMSRVGSIVFVNVTFKVFPSPMDGGLLSAQLGIRRYVPGNITRAEQNDQHLSN